MRKTFGSTKGTDVVRSQALPVVAFAILCGDIHKSGATEELTASITPARPVSRPGKRSHGCLCDLEVHKTDMAALVGVLSANGYSHHIHNAEPPFQQVTIDFGWAVTVWEACGKIMGVMGNVQFDHPQYFCSLSGDVEAEHPELVIFDKRAGKAQIAIRQNLSGAGRDTPPTPYTGEQWGMFFGALLRSGLFQPGMLLLEDPGVDDNVEFYAVEGVLTRTAEQRFGQTLTTILQLFPTT